MSVTPSDTFDLGDWKLQLPVDSDGDFDGSSTEIRNLKDYSSSWFFTGLDGAMVLTAPVEGATTSGSKYARSELRELADGANAAWSLDEGGYMAATLQVDMVPEKFDGTEAKVTIGQIHGGDHQLVRLYYEQGTVYWVNGRNEVQSKDAVYQLRDARGRTPDIDLNETFSYNFEVQGDRLSLSLQADATTYTSQITIGEGWDDNLFYFKAGLYLGTNETNSHGNGQVSMFDLFVSHDGPRPTTDTSADTSGDGSDEPAPAPEPVLLSGATITGTNYADVLLGTGASETIDGKRSNDQIAGMGGRDSLFGGSGSDAFLMSSPETGADLVKDWESKDQILLDASTFGSVAKGVGRGNFVVGTAALDQDDHLIYDQLTGRLYYDADGSGGAAAMLFAEIENCATLTYSDFGLF